MAVKTAATIVEHARRHPDHAVEILKAVVIPNFRPNKNDQLAKRRVRMISELLKQVPVDDLTAVLELYKALILRPGAETEKDANLQRQGALDQVVWLVKSCQNLHLAQFTSPSAQVIFLTKALELLVSIGYFNHTKSANTMVPPFSSRSQQDARTRLTSCLSHLMNAASDPYYFFRIVIDEINRGEQSTSGLECIVESNAALRTAHTTLEGMKDGSEIAALRLLYSLTILEVYNGDADALAMLDELEQCYKPIRNAFEAEAKPAQHQDGSQAFVEIILSFIAKPSQLFRRMAHHVFNTYASNLRASGMETMLTILGTEETLRGQAEIFDGGKDDEEGSTSGSLQGVEMHEGDIDNQEPPSSAGSESSDASISDGSKDGDEEEEEEGDIGNEQEDAELMAKLAQILNTKPPPVSSGLQANGNTGPVESLESEDSSDSDMTDSQMQALDGPLSAVLREIQVAKSTAKSKKTEKRNAKDTIVNFKTRVLELIEIYLKKEPINPIAIGALVPILQCIRTTQSPQVSKRACEVIKQYAKAAKASKRTDVPALSVAELQAVHLEARIGGSNAFGAACSQASLIISRLMKEQGADIRVIIDVYADSMENYKTDPSCQAKPVLFTDWIQWLISTGPNHA